MNLKPTFITGKFSLKQIAIFVVVFGALGGYFIWHSLAASDWGNWVNLGGNMGSGPAVTSTTSGGLDVFAVGVKHALWYKTCANKTTCAANQWSDWRSLGGDLTSDPAAASWADGHIDVFARGSTNNNMMHIYYDQAKGWSKWQNLGGGATSAPSVASMGPGKLDVFARGADNALWHRYCLSASQCENGPWAPWTSLGGSLTAGPSAVSWGSTTNGRIAVFAVGANSSLQELDYSQSAYWGGWTNLGGCVVGHPAVVSQGLGRLDVLTRGCDNKLNDLYSTNEKGWVSQSIGGTLTSSPGAVSWTFGHIDAFSRFSGNTIHKISYDVSAGPPAGHTTGGSQPPAHPPAYGLAFNPLVPQFVNNPDFSQISGPGSRYNNALIRTVVDYNAPNAAQMIQGELQYATQHMGYTTGTAPVVISMGLTDIDVNNFAGKTVCSSTVVSQTCQNDSEAVVNRYLPQLMTEFPQVKYWTTLNEPEAGDKPTNALPGSNPANKYIPGKQPGDQGYLAARMWIDADKIAVANGRVMIAGEFLAPTGYYEQTYEKDIAADVTTAHLAQPTAWAVHPYNDVICARDGATSDTARFMQDLKSAGLYNAMQKGDGMWITEAGVELDNTTNCPNEANLGDVHLSNGQPKPTTALTGSDLNSIEAAQVNAAQTFMNFYKVDSNVDFHLFYYTPDPGSPQCWSGGNWDSGLWAPDGKVPGSLQLYGDDNGVPVPLDRRPAFYVLTQSTVPNLVQSVGVQQAALRLVPPVYWVTPPSAPSVDRCYYGHNLPIATS